MLRPPARKRTPIPSASNPSTTDAKAPRCKALWARLDLTPQHIGVSFEKMSDRREIPRQRLDGDLTDAGVTFQTRHDRAVRAAQLRRGSASARSVAADEGRRGRVGDEAELDR